MDFCLSCAPVFGRIRDCARAAAERLQATAQGHRCRSGGIDAAQAARRKTRARLSRSHVLERLVEHLSDAGGERLLVRIGPL